MTNKKNVLYIGGFRLPDKNAAAQRVMANGKLFSKVGYNVSFIDVDVNGGDSKKFLKTVYDGLDYLVKSQKYPQTKYEWFFYITNVKFIINAVENDLSFKPDIIVLDYLNLMAATYGNNSYERIKNISEQITSKIIEEITGDKLNESSIKATIEETSKTNLSKYL